MALDKNTNPSEIARETLRLLATRRLAPTPENYRLCYFEASGQTDTNAEAASAPPSALPLAPVWAELIGDLLKQWEARQVGLTTARKRDGLEKLLNAPGSDAGALATKLRHLVSSWSTGLLAPAEPIGLPDAATTAAPQPTTASTPAHRGAPAPASGTEPGGVLPQICELLAQTLEFAVTAQLGHAPDLAKEADKLALAARTQIGRAHV